MFPEKFYFGASLAGFQYEMGADEKDLDAQTDWYQWVTNPLNIRLGIVSGDDPVDGPGYWRRYAQFHELAKDAGMNMLRIGIEWSRLFPEPDMKEANPVALEGYKRIIRDIHEKGMKVMVNLNHFTLPLWLHDPIGVNQQANFSRNGWADDRTPVEFAKFAGWAGKNFPEVDYWSTMNEPLVVLSLGYLLRDTGFPPSIISPTFFEKGFTNYQKAHLLAYDAVKKESSVPVGLIYAFPWVCTSKRVREEKYKKEEWRFLDPLVQKMDFLGVNYYSRLKAEKIGEEIKFLPGFGQAAIPNGFSPDGRPASDFGWECFPEGLYNVCKTLFQRYKKPILITENGAGDRTDGHRPYYLLSHLYAVEKLVDEGFPLFGYLHWSLTDNYEWAKGFSQRFGLVQVDFQDKTLTPRPSYYIFQKIAKERTTQRFRKYLQQPYRIWDEKELI